ncbi:hypothetical protein M8J75_005183 [Diaphorina citri]|nr:hypothetical protein M8J75_005183 [Diaphorina citri]
MTPIGSWLTFPNTPVIPGAKKPAAPNWEMCSSNRAICVSIPSALVLAEGPATLEPAFPRANVRVLWKGSGLTTSETCYNPSTCYTPNLSTCYTPNLSTCYTPNLSTCYPPNLLTCYPPNLSTCYPPNLSTCYPPNLSTCYPPNLSTCYPPNLSTCYPPNLSTCSNPLNSNFNLLHSTS